MQVDRKIFQAAEVEIVTLMKHNQTQQAPYLSKLWYRLSQVTKQRASVAIVVVTSVLSLVATIK